MADLVDRSEEEAEFMLDASLADIQHKVTKIPPGVAGECDRCGEEMPRLVDGNCCKCRDKFKLY